ncbi:MAG: FecR domain-containing protein [Tannerella sp.]|jgi:ferric-dicitrate binding protein FerR (iron transport regulator)|nr:FecR domain-containing protein [Tannerella sp.]
MSIITHIIRLFSENDYPRETQDKFKDWLLDDAHKAEKEEALADLWRSLPEGKADASTLAALKQVEERTGAGKRSRNRRLHYWMVAAAVVAAALASGILTGLYYHAHRQNAGPVALAECFAPDGELRRLVLPDSSVVTLNSGSLLVYPKQAGGHERYVYLNGEAFFEVKHDAERPFVVKTDGVDVRVLGTQFDVSAYPDEADITTTLLKGSVRLHFPKHPDLPDYQLQPDYQLIFNKKNAWPIMKKVSDKYIGAWRNNKLTFSASPLEKVLETFGHHFNVEVYFNSHSYYGRDLLTLKLVHNETLKESLEILRRIVPHFNYKLSDNKLYIY